MTALFVAEAITEPSPQWLAALGPVFAHWSEADRQLLVYADAPREPMIAAALPEAIRHALLPRLAIAGASQDATPRHHYVVWTDAAPGWDAELSDWYEQEHLPGLASVPGAVLARRFEQAGPGPRHFACYDLTAPEVLGSPAWLAVRATDWSSRVRPNFTNTRRWMCRTLRTPHGIAA